MKVSTLLVLALGVAAVIASPIENDGKRLIKTGEPDPGTWMTEDEVIALRLSGKGFVDITDHRGFSLEKAVPRYITTFPVTPRFQPVVKSLLQNANRTRVENFVREFSSLLNRHSRSETGEQSQKWLLSLINEALNGYNGNSLAEEIKHTWKQNSIIARIDGTDLQLKNQIVIIGSHLDSFAGWTADPAPGADDNGSGCAVTLEVLRILSAARFRPKKTVEFHWYAAEEQGLKDSTAIAEKYKAKNARVAAMLNLDVIGWQENGTTDIGIFTDYGNPALIEFNKALVDEYLTYGRRRNRTCGYACSDHASWLSEGYPAAFVAKVKFTPALHTKRDTFETVEFTQVMEFVKLTMGFVIELAEPNLVKT